MTEPFPHNGVHAGRWLATLDHPDPATRAMLDAVYGPVADARLNLLKKTLRAFVERFGDGPVRVFRSPGRINLRGMHVDTHGGYLNLMTHQRETVVVAAERNDDRMDIANLDPAFEPVQLSIHADTPRLAPDTPWPAFVQQEDVRSEAAARRGHWAHYLKGCAFAMRHQFPERRLRGINGVIGSDLPHGAALSSSAALCVATLLALTGANNVTLSSLDLIVGARNAEWYTGSRCGLSDQAAMVLGRRGAVVNLAIYPPAPDVTDARYIPFDESTARILVINSYTRRSLSGAEQARYTTNRFAYSLALEIFRQEMRRDSAHYPEDLLGRMDRLSAITAEAFAAAGGPNALMRLMRRVPEHLSLDALRARYDLPEFDQAYEQYFGPVPEEHRPRSVGLRGPLLFGISESERARTFPALVSSGNWTEAGASFTVGHRGDRVREPNGVASIPDISDAALDRMMAESIPVTAVSGAYGASSPALDALVDAALEGGAWGACLTGAGIAGTVLALGPGERLETVKQSVGARLASAEYRDLAHLESALDTDQLEAAVVDNVAVAGAGELIL